MKSDQYKTILVINTGFLVLFVIFKYDLFLYIALGISGGALLSGYLRTGIIWTWSKFAEILGFINTRILLSIIYYLLLVPLSGLRKLFSGDYLKIKRVKEDSLFQVRDHKFTKEDMTNPW